MVTGEQIIVPLSTIEQGKMVHFYANMSSSKEAFMAYKMDGVIYIRANICVPCRSYSFSLEKGVLVCDTCGTRFNAKTGIGISGACVSYPKSPAVFHLTGGDVVTNLADLASAYADTLQLG